MKAVILAAGKSVRTYPLTLTRPKPLVRIANKTLIEHNLYQLLDLVDEVIIIVGYKAGMIKKHLGDNFHHLKIRYVTQKQQLGTGHALIQAEKYVKKDRFIVMMGDDLYFRGDMRKCLKYKYSVLARRVGNYADFGVFVKKEDKVMDIVEKPREYVSDLVNAAFYVFDGRIFTYLHKLKKSTRGEYELTGAFKQLAAMEDIFSVEAKVWLPIGYPWNVLEADQIVRDVDVNVGKNSKVGGRVSDCTIGRNCVIEGMVKKSIIGDNVIIHKGSVVEDSVIGDNVEFKGEVKSRDNMEIEIRGKKMTVDYFGAAIGDNAKLIGVNVNAGTMIWPGVKKKNKELKGIVKS